MTSAKKLITGIPLFIIITSLTLTTEAADETNGIKVSGGEDHSLVLAENNTVWARGENCPISLKFPLNSIYRNGIIQCTIGEASYGK